MAIGPRHVLGITPTVSDHGLLIRIANSLQGQTRLVDALGQLIAAQFLNADLSIVVVGLVSV